MKPKPRDAGDRVHHRLVTEQRLAGEATDDVRHHAHRRQNHDVHGRMAIKPKQMLPQQRLTAARGVERIVGTPTFRNEKPGAERQIDQLHEAGRREHRQRERLQNGRDEHGPNRHRQAKHRHAGGTHLDDRRQIIDRAHHRRNADARQSDEPEHLRIARERQRRIRSSSRNSAPCRQKSCTEADRTPAT